MRKYILALLILIAAVVPFFIFGNRYCPLRQSLIKKEKTAYRTDLQTRQDNLLKYLKSRKDKLASAEVEKILSSQPDNLEALWGRAELLRRAYKLKESEHQLKDILSKYPNHASSLISLAYIKYHDHNFEEGLRILKQVLDQPDLERENKALAYMLIGSINAKRSSLGGLGSKLAYGFRIAGYFQKAKAIAPDLSEVRLGLGTFYLLAPTLIGGDLNKAVAELEYAVQLTPDFATANARLAQAYQKKGDLEKYIFYIQRVKELDPENKILQETRPGLEAH